MKPLCLSLLVSLLPGAILAQGVPRLDSTYMAPVTSAGQWLIFWATDEGANGEQAVYLKNTSADRSITITSWEVYECYKVAGGVCGKRDKGPTIKPGKTVRLFLARGIRGSTEGFSYKYRFSQQWTEALLSTTP